MSSRSSRRAFVLEMLALGLPVPAGADESTAASATPSGRASTLARTCVSRDAGGSAARESRPPSPLEPNRRRRQRLDHTPVPPGDPRVFGEQLGQGRSSRAPGHVHIAIFDAGNAVVGGYPELHAPSRWPPRTHPSRPPIALAAQRHADRGSFAKADLDAELVEDLSALATGRQANGVTLGRAAAAAILERRANDGAQHPEPRVGIDTSRATRLAIAQDPISENPLAMALAGRVTPFVLRSGIGFVSAPSISTVGSTRPRTRREGAGRRRDVTPTVRTADQTLAGHLRRTRHADPVRAAAALQPDRAAHRRAAQDRAASSSARLLALVTWPMADAGIAIWESKYHYVFWRPVTGIRESDGNPRTPPIPRTRRSARPRATSRDELHSAVPGVPLGPRGVRRRALQILRDFYGTDRIPFTFVSDELNGETLDNEGNARPLVPRSFSSLSEAEEENGQSRIYLGIPLGVRQGAGHRPGPARGRRRVPKAFVRQRRSRPPTVAE